MDTRALELQSHAESRDLLLQVLANQEELKRVVVLHQAGSSIAEDIMQEGQEVAALLQGCAKWKIQVVFFIETKRNATIPDNWQHVHRSANLIAFFHVSCFTLPSSEQAD